MNCTDLTLPSSELSKTSGEMIDTVVSNFTRLLFEVVNEVSLGAAVAVFGIFANIVNLNIFARQGFSSTVNIALFGLSVSDLCSLTCLVWFGICKNPLASEAFHFGQGLCYLTGGCTRGYFTRVTGCITAYAAAERCVCITFPLTYRRLLSPARTCLVVSFIYVANALLVVLEYNKAYIGWTFNPLINQSVIDLHVTVEWKRMNTMAYIVHAFFELLIFVTVILFTTVLVLNLQRTSKWRKTVTSCQGRVSSISGRDTKTTKLISLIAALLILCNVPGVTICITMFVVPDFSVGGKYYNYQLIMWTFGNLFESANSGFTIFIYYTMSSKYRRLFDQIFCKSQVKVPDNEEKRVH